VTGVPWATCAHGIRLPSASPANVRPRPRWHSEPMTEPTATPTNGPLADIVVVDLSRALAGPQAGMMLGDMGARVAETGHPTLFFSSTDGWI